MGVLDWAPTPARNASADPDIRASDGTSARDLPAAVRGVMAATVALALDQGGALVSSGTDNVYVIETNSGIRPQPGATLSFWADRDNTAEPSLNVDGSGPRRWRGADGLSLPAGAIQGGLLYTVTWAGPEVGKAPGWYTTGSAGASGAAAGVAFDVSGTLAERAKSDAAPKGTVYLAVADTPQGPSWTLYLKRSNAYADWSTGLPIKAQPAQSTADAQAAADRAAAQVPLASQAGAAQVALAAGQVDLARGQAQAAAVQAVNSADARSGSEIARDVAVEQAAAARRQAASAAVAAIEARNVSQNIGAQIYDFSFDSAPSSSDDWSN